MPHPESRTLRVNINLSARQFSDPDLVDKIQNLVKETRIDPSQLCVEVTENAVMEDLSAAVSMLQKIKDLNVTVAIDDFGIGYSSLTYLRQMPADILKLDRSFISSIRHKDDESSQVVAAVVKLTHALGMTAVAEGVETSEQLILLKELGCDYAQGFYLSPPISAEKAISLAVNYGQTSVIPGINRP